MLEESITEHCDTEMKEKNPVKENHDADVEEKKSITGENDTAIKAEKLEDMITEPDPLLHNKKW